MDTTNIALVRTAARFTLAVTSVILASVLVIEHVLGYAPCKLCYQQRVPFYAALFLSAMLSLTPRSAGRTAFWGLVNLAFLFLVSSGMALNHVGVEAAWWPGPSDCSGAMPSLPTDVKDFAASLSNAKVVSCTTPALLILGLSLSAWNLVVSLCLLVGISIAAWKARGIPVETASA